MFIFRVGKSAVVTIDEPARLPFTSIELSSTGDQIESQNSELTRQIWDARSGQLIQPATEAEVMDDDTQRYRAVAVAGPSAGLFDTATELWSLKPRQRLWRKELFVAGEFAPGGDHLTGRREGMAEPDLVGIFRSKDGMLVAGWQPPDTACSSGRGWSADGRRFAALDDENIHAVDVPSRQHQAFKVLDGEACGIRLIDMSPDGRHFASPFRLFAFEPIREHARFARPCACEGMSERPVSFSPDGRFLALLWNAPPTETAVFRVEPFEPTPLFTLPGDAVWLAGTSVIAATQRADQPTMLLVRVPDGARFVLDARKPDLEALRAFVASAPR